MGSAARNAHPDRAWLSISRDAMAHRGPDDAGEWWSEDGRVTLGHRRLAVVDLSPSGHQPMLSADRQLAIVLNGEIYNFRELRAELRALGYCFRSSSDTEVLLAAYDKWDTECLSHIDGMFAFGIYDARSDRLFLARDRAGEKPLFYRLSSGTLNFASELKALMTQPGLPRQLSPISLDCYLYMGFVPGRLCILQGYEKLPPAHAMTFDASTGTTRIWRYWQLPGTIDAAAKTPDEENLVREMEVLLEDAVRHQLLADVPVGVLLSGGVDSSLIAAMAARSSSKVRTFTVGFPGHGAFDETRHARIVAEYFGTEHTELPATPMSADLLPLLARQFDEPVADSSMIPTCLVSELVRRHCTVALGGDGGDELFGGYHHYSRLMWMLGNTAPIPGPLRKWAAGVATNLPLGVKGRNWLEALGADLRKELPPIGSLFDAPMRARLLTSRPHHELAAEEIRRRLVPDEPDLLQRATRMDFHTYLPEDLLVKVDRSSMLNSLEVRAPFLDHRVIEFAFGKVPSTLRATSTGRKVLLKRLASRILPAGFDVERKQGFSIPLADWLKAGRFRQMFHEVLLDPGCLFDRNVVNGLLEGQDRGRNNGERLFALVFLELWRRQYSVAA